MITAKFLYWDLGFTKDPMYDLVEGNADFPTGSSVSDKTLIKMGCPIPLTPDKETYLKMVSDGLRCRKCWSSERCLHGFPGAPAANGEVR